MKETRSSQRFVSRRCNLEVIVVHFGGHSFSCFFFPSLQSFKQMIASCLVKDPSKRPTSKKLLKHSFFKQARSSDYIARTLLEGLPALGDRIQALKVAFCGCKSKAFPILVLEVHLFNLNVLNFIEKGRRYGCPEENA